MQEKSTIAVIQQALIEAGEAIDAAELAAGVVGSSTAAAVRHFQAHHVGPDGHANRQASSI
jgi:peptidoglycan hydrolase-like protein with peptidoglycan-binding domain